MPPPVTPHDGRAERDGETGVTAVRGLQRRATLQQGTDAGARCACLASPNRYDIIVIGASAGGIRALKVLASGLPATLPVAICIVLRLSARGLKRLPELLMHAGPLPAAYARDGEAIQAGRIYVAPPDHHLTLTPGVACVRHGPKERGFRPAIDPLFRSAAHAYGPRLVGVILTGMLDDGTAGLLTVKARGGLTVVQAPEEACYAAMPRHAVQALTVDYCLPLAALAPWLVCVTHTSATTCGGHVAATDPERHAHGHRVHGPRAAVAPDPVTICPMCGALVPGVRRRSEALVEQSQPLQTQSQHLRWQAQGLCVWSKALRQKAARLQAQFPASRRQGTVSHTPPELY